MKQKLLSEKVRSLSNLWGAWGTIRSNGQASGSNDTKAKIRDFDSRADFEIRRMNRRLQKGVYQFTPAVGVAQPKSGGEHRPIVIAPVENRVVQRAILDVIQGEPSLAELYNNEFSFGGLAEKGVPAAVRAVQDKILNGRAGYFLCSDIGGFFKSIGRANVVNDLSRATSDLKFQKLFKEALDTELSNMDFLKAKGHFDLFPISETGVAQGCCLSPLVGNIYLRDFDHAMNQGDISCFRYIDDFIILGPNAKAVHAAFRRAVQILKSLGLSAYDPKESPHKAWEGPTDKPFNYLGCTIEGETVRPSRESWKRLKADIDEIFQKSLQNTQRASGSNAALSLSNVTQSVSKRLEGWTKQYALMCNDLRIMDQWQVTIEEAFLTYENTFLQLTRDYSRSERVKMLGLFNIKESFEMKVASRVLRNKRRHEDQKTKDVTNAKHSGK